MISALENGGRTSATEMSARSKYSRVIELVAKAAAARGGEGV